MKLISAILFLVFLSNAFSNILYVDLNDTTKYNTMQEAFANSQAGDTILLNSDSLTVVNLSLDHSISVFSNPDRLKKTVISGSNFMLSSDGIVLNNIYFNDIRITIDENLNNIRIANNYFDLSSIICNTGDSISITNNIFISKCVFFPATITSYNSFPIIANNSFYIDNSCNGWVSGIEYRFNDTTYYHLDVPRNIFDNKFTNYETAILFQYFCPPVCIWDTVLYDISKNWWGTNDSSSIQSLINDQTGGWMNVAFTYTPFLDTIPDSTMTFSNDSIYTLNYNSFNNCDHGVTVRITVANINDDLKTLNKLEPYNGPIEYIRLNGTIIPSGLKALNGIYFKKQGSTITKILHLKTD